MSFPLPKVALKNWYAGWPLDLWNYLVGLIAALNRASTPYVRAVITNFPAGVTFAAGVVTGPASTALGTQDGVTTLAVGDQVMLPPATGNGLPSGTYGTAITAAQSGPYLITSLGSGTTAFVLTRPSWYAHGSLIVPAVSFKVGDEGTVWGNTTWRAGPATATKVVDTDDPQMMPERVTLVGVLLALGTFAITSVPLRATGRISVTAYTTASSTTAGTVGYGLINAATPGAIGTATATVDALAATMIKNGADTSTLNVTIEQ